MSKNTVRYHHDGMLMLSYWPFYNEYTISHYPFAEKAYINNSNPSFHRLQMRIVLMKLGVVV